MWRATGVGRGLAEDSLWGTGVGRLAEDSLWGTGVGRRLVEDSLWGTRLTGRGVAIFLLAHSMPINKGGGCHGESYVRWCVYLEWGGVMAVLLW